MGRTDGRKVDALREISFRETSQPWRMDQFWLNSETLEFCALHQ